MCSRIEQLVQEEGLRYRDAAVITGDLASYGRELSHQFDEAGIPQIYVFRTCREFIRTIPLLQYDKVKPEDVDSDGEDHQADEMRYLCMARPISPVKSSLREKRPYDPLEETSGDYGRYDFYL